VRWQARESCRVLLGETVESDDAADAAAVAIYRLTLADRRRRSGRHPRRGLLPGSRRRSGGRAPRRPSTSTNSS